ncbi:hypothetical protein FO519_006083 [Halicephalobus sp. NKZ332]|nr:hypothetical protein FO519_006083 [Halicephalobus sp. NKZ332]
MMGTVDAGKSVISMDIDSVNLYWHKVTLMAVLRAFNPGREEQEAWLDVILEVTGAGKKLNDFIEELAPNINQLKSKIYPAVQKMEDMEKRFDILKQTLSREQNEQLSNDGYTFMDLDQMAFIHGNDPSSKKFPKTKEEHEKKLEDDIRKLAKFDGKFNLNSENSRFRRQTKNQKMFIKKSTKFNKKPNSYSESSRFRRQVGDNRVDQGNVGNDGIGGNRQGEGNEGSGENENNGEGVEHEFYDWNVLRPWAFVNRMNETVVWEATILSPHAFSVEHLAIETLSFHLLSPRAFQPALLSPSILLSRVLSPLAFGAEVLSPRAFVAFVLSPQTLFTEVLSPQFFEAHIASPDVLTIQILSPNIFAPRIASPDIAGIIVLSPNILSPRILSPERMLVEILSPHILGGEETEEEEESNFHHESDLPEAHKYHRHSQGKPGAKPPWLLDKAENEQLFGPSDRFPLF